MDELVIRMERLLLHMAIHRGILLTEAFLYYTLKVRDVIVWSRCSADCRNAHGGVTHQSPGNLHQLVNRVPQQGTDCNKECRIAISCNRPLYLSAST